MAAIPPSLSGGLKSERCEKPASPEPTGRRPLCARRWAILGLLITGGMTVFYGLGTFRSLGSHEVYAVVPAREMLESGNWVFPTFGELPRLRKPPLAYWIVAGSAKLFGELTPLTARIPSALAGVLLSVLMGVWARRWYGPSVGWAAMFVQLTSVWFVLFARKSEIDMILCLMTTSALFLAVHQPAEEKPGWFSLRWLAIYAILSLAWLAKFHFGPAMVLTPIFAYFAVQNNWRSFQNLLNPVGLCCLISAIVIWPLLVLQQAPEAWDIWQRETWGRALGAMGGHPFYYYIPYLAAMPLPWTFFAWARLPESWRLAWRKRDANERFLWIWFFAQAGILLLSASKHKHYLLPMMPIFTLLAARSVSATLHAFHSGRLRMPRRRIVACWSLNLALGMALIGAIQYRFPEHAAAAWVFGLSICVFHSIGWALLDRGNIAGVVGMNIAVLGVGCLLLADWIVPQYDRRANLKSFAAEVRQNLSKEEPICVYAMDRDPLVYHLGTPVYRAESLNDLKKEIEKAPLYVVGYEHFVNELNDIAIARPVARLPKGQGRAEPVEGDLVLVKLLPRHTTARPILSPRPNAN